MIINAFWLATIALMIITQIYLLSKYISNKNEIFIDNKYASFVNGILTYIFITFISFLPFIFIDVNIIYLIIVFWIKEGVTFIFLLTREQNYFDINYLKKYLFVFIFAILISIIWNYGIAYLIQPIEETKPSKFSAIYLINDVIAKTSSLDTIIVKKWFTNLFVSLIGVSSVLALMSEFSLSTNYKKRFIGIIMTIFAIILFSYKLPLWQNSEIFIQVFVMIVCSRILQYSRRRYGFLFVVISIASFSMGDHSRLGLWGISIVTMSIYTFLRKPKSSLFWVMLISPLLIVEALKAYRISPVLSIILVIFSIFIFIFMISLQGARPLQKLNNFFEKFRIIVPIAMGLIIFISALSIVFINNINWLSLPTIKNSFIYIIHDNTIFSWINFGIYIFIFSYLFIYFINKIIRKNKFLRIDYIYMISLLLIIVIFNPLINAMLSISTFANDVQYLVSLIFLPILILIANESIEFKKANNY